MTRHKGVRLPVSILDTGTGCDTVLVCLPQVAIPVLVSLSERLSWSSTWLDGDGRRADLTDGNYQTIDAIIGGLLSAMCIEDLINAIRNDMMTTINNYVYCGDGCGGQSTTLYCVGQDGNPVVNPIPVGDDDPTVIPLPPGLTEPPVVDPGTGEPPAGWDDWESYDADACRAANALVEYLYQVCRRYEELMVDDIPNMAGWFVVIVDLVTQGGLVFLFKAELLYNIASFTSSVQTILALPAAAFAYLADTVETNRANWVCYLYNMRGNVGSWETALLAKLFEAAAGGLANETEQGALYTLLQMLLPQFVALSQLYGVVTYSGTFSGHDCSLCEEEEVQPPEGFTWYVPSMGEIILTDGTYQDVYHTGVGGIAATGTSPAGGGGEGALIGIDAEAINTRVSGDGAVAVEWSITVYPGAEFGRPTPSGGITGGSIDVPSKMLYASGTAMTALFDDMRATYDYVHQPTSSLYLETARSWTKMYNIPANIDLALEIRVRVLVSTGA
jgi:hypothetical protein